MLYSRLSVHGKKYCARCESKNKSNTVVIAGHVTLKLSSFYFNSNGKGVRNDFSVREVRFY